MKASERQHYSDEDHSPALVVQIMRCGHARQESFQSTIKRQNRDIPDPSRENLRCAGVQVLAGQEYLQCNRYVRGAKDQKDDGEGSLNREE